MLSTRGFAVAALLISACASSPSAPPPAHVLVVVPPQAHVEPLQVEGASASPATSTVVIRADHAGSRSYERPRVLRRLLAERRGKLELARGYTEVSLVVAEVVSGALDDPDYAKRPVGVNVLPVVMTDEAAFAAPDGLDGLDGFRGTWRLTRLADGTLIASSIRDTPFPPGPVAQRGPIFDLARSALRETTPEQRVAGLDVLDAHAFYELVPDVIALLDDTRSDNAPPQRPGHGHSVHGPRVVKEVAAQRLRTLAAPFADEATPTSGDRLAWEAFWKDLLSRDPYARPAPVTPSTRVELARLPMNQTWPSLVATTPGNFMIGISRLQTPLDGHADGIALTQPAGKLLWVSSQPQDGLDAAPGPTGLAMVAADIDGTWHFAIAPSLLDAAPPSTGAALVPKNATHCALAASDKGFAIAYVRADASSLFMLALDANGKPRGAARALPLPAMPETSYHRGIYPVALARRKDGWVAVVEAQSGVLLANVTDSLALVGVSPVAEAAGIAQPKVIVSRDRAFVVWSREGGTRSKKLAFVLLSFSGQALSKLGTAGAEVELISRPINLDDGGFAVAWIESGTELHVGRWNAAGDLVAAVLVQPQNVAASAALALGRDASGLIVAFEDSSRYPYTLVTRHIDVSALAPATRP